MCGWKGGWSFTAKVICRLATVPAHPTVSSAEICFSEMDVSGREEVFELFVRAIIFNVSRGPFVLRLCHDFFFAAVFSTKNKEGNK